MKIHKVFIKFSPGFHEAFSKSFHQAALGFQTDFDRFFDQVFTKFSPGFENSPGFHQVFTKFSPSFHQVFTKFSPGFHQVFTKFSASFHQVFTKFSPGSHQVSTEFSPGFYQVFTRFSPSFHLVLKIHHQVLNIHQVFTRSGNFTRFSPSFEDSPGFHAVPISKVHRMFVSYFTVSPVFIKIWILKCHQVCARSEKSKRASKMITCDLDVLPKYQIPLRCLYLYWQSQLFISNQKYLISYCTVELPDTTWYSHVFTNHIEVSKVSCLQWHVSSIELNMQLRDILNHLKPTAEAAASTSVFVHLFLGQNTNMCLTTLGALPKLFFGFDIPSRSWQPQLSNLTFANWFIMIRTLMCMPVLNW